MMSLIKFITVYDDESQSLMYEDIMKTYNISSYPPAYYFNNKTSVDGINTDSTQFMKQKSEIECIRGPIIPADVFKIAINNAYNQGYALALIVCPNKKWYPYYYDAVKAANRYRRSIKKDFRTFSVSVIDSRAFAAGSLYYTLQLARLHINHHCPTGIILEDAKNLLSKTIVLTSSGERFGFKNGNLVAFRVIGKRLYKYMDISESSDYVKFNNFAKICERYVRLSGSKYIISFGAGCYFSGNVIGRIEKLIGYPPVAISQYGVASADVLGTETICIHF